MSELLSTFENYLDFSLSFIITFLIFIYLYSVINYWKYVFVCFNVNINTVSYCFLIYFWSNAVKMRVYDAIKMSIRCRSYYFENIQKRISNVVGPDLASRLQKKKKQKPQIEMRELLLNFCYSILNTWFYHSMTHRIT